MRVFENISAVAIANLSLRRRGMFSKTIAAESMRVFENISHVVTNQPLFIKKHLQILACV